MRKQILILMIVLILLVNIFLVNAQPTQKIYSEEEIKSLYLSVNRYDSTIKKYVEHFSDEDNPIPVNLVKAIMALESEGILNDRTTNFNHANATGLMQIVPFKADGSYMHYQTCLNAACMSVRVEESDDIEVKKDKIRTDYANPEHSICCGIKILNDYYSDQSKHYETDSCNVIVSPKDYSGWNRASRSYNGFGCPPDATHAYYTELVNQLWAGFDQLKGITTSKFGAIKYTPSFAIDAPTFYFDIYKDLNDMINNKIKNKKKESEVNTALNTFETAHPGMTFTFCEEPEVNLVNYFYDNLVNAMESDVSGCLYPVAGQGNPFSLEIKPQTWTFNDLLGDLNFKNNLTSHLYREFDFNTPNNFNLIFNTIESKYDNSYFMDYTIKDFVSNSNKKLEDVNKIYFLKNYESSSNFIFQKKDGTYYNSNGDLINLEELQISECDSATDYYKVKYFNCLDTNIKEQIFDWSTHSWKDSEDTIKIKFAFSLNKN